MKYCALFFLLLLTVPAPGNAPEQSVVPQLDVLRYRAEVTLEISQEALSATADILLTNASDIPLPSIPLDLAGLSVLSVTIDQAPVAWTHDFGVLLVYPSQPLLRGDTVSLRIVYGGLPISADGCGPVFGEVSYCLPQSRTLDYLCTTSHWLPIHNCFADKAVWDLTFNVPEGLTAASIGRLEDQASAQGRSRFRWVEELPTPPHAVTWAVADYACVRDTILGIPAEYYVLQRDVQNASSYFAPVADMIEFYTTLVGPWPAEKIGFCWIPDGSGEGQGMIAAHIENWDVPAGMAEAHALAHQWFGGGCTPACLDENWLSDGIATYMAWAYQSQRYGFRSIDAIARSAAVSYRTETVAVEGALPLYGFSKYIDDNAPETIRCKGALVLNMLRHAMGDAAFHDGLRTVAQSRRGGTVTSADFCGVMEQAAGRTLQPFIAQWVHGAGWPVCELRRFTEEPDGAFKLRVRQTQQERDWPLFALIVEIDIMTRDGDTLRIVEALPAVENSIIVVDSVPNMDILDWRFDPDGWLLMETASVTAVAQPPAAVAGLRLDPPYPQPLSAAQPRGMLPFSLTRGMHVRADLCDLLGRRILSVADARYGPGRHQLAIDGAGVAPGYYRLLLQTGNVAASVPLVIR